MLQVKFRKITLIKHTVNLTLAKSVYRDMYWASA